MIYYTRIQTKASEYNNSRPYHIHCESSTAKRQGKWHQQKKVLAVVPNGTAQADTPKRIPACVNAV